jgi:Recombination endonuclease VII
MPRKDKYQTLSKRLQSASYCKEWRLLHPLRTKGYKQKEIAKRRAKLEAKAGRARPKVCDLCGGGSWLNIVFDHCHTKGHFRGWLCDRCNTVLGQVGDDADLLRRMADYLEEKGNGRVDNENPEEAAQLKLCLAG